MHSFILHYRMARFGKVVYVADDLMLLNQNTYDKDAKEKRSNVSDLKGSINFKKHIILGVEIKHFLQK